jgi:hypothetical protein
MEASFEIELSDLTDDAVRRLLKDAIRQERLNSLPAGKRAAAKKAYAESPEEENEEDDNDANVEMNRRGVKTNLPNVTGEDLPRGIKVTKYKGRKHGKGS